jgi:hypothetical protein
MPTYIYETIPAKGKKPKRFELWQLMKDAALTKHPKTGEPVRRIITGGADFFLPNLIVERPSPPPRKKSRFDRKPRPAESRPTHYDHGDDHHH